MLDKEKFEFFVSLDRRYLETFEKRIDVGINIDDLTDDLLPDLMEYLFYEYFPELDGIRLADSEDYGLIQTPYELYENFSWYGDYSQEKIDKCYEELNELVIAKV